MMMIIIINIGIFELPAVAPELFTFPAVRHGTRYIQ